MRLATAFILSLVCVLISCGGDDPADVAPPADVQPDRLVIYTVNHPLAYFAERIGGDEVEVVFPAPHGEDPAFWSPDAEAITAYQGVDLILLNGAGYAKWVERATLPTAKLVDTSAGYTDRLIELTGTVTHSHGPKGEHEHGGWAFTTWLDPTLAVEQARAVAAALQVRLPESTTAIESRSAALEAELMSLDERFAAAAAVLGTEPLLFSHPVYHYLIQRYGLNGRQLHWEPDQEPDREMWSELEHLVDHYAARWMLWEGQPLDETVAGLDDRGISSVVFSPCANLPAEGDWMAVMTANAAVLEAIAAAVDGT
jgi:zinc transport system substrate-binding protein